MKKHLIAAIAATFAIFLVGCGSSFGSGTSSSVAGDLNAGLGCTNSRSKVFAAYTKAYENNETLDADVFKNELQTQILKNRKLAATSSSRRLRYAKAIEALHAILTSELREIKIRVTAPAENENDPTLHLARLEMRSQIDPQYEILNRELDAVLNEAQIAAHEAGVECVTPEAPFAAKSDTTPLHGAYFTMATAYQSCGVLSQPLVTSSVGSTRGVEKGAMVDDVGYGREYTDVALLKSTHYYHRAQKIYAANCADQSAKPLVYDYGGKPVFKNSIIDLFTNSGGGGALGVDCSAFVSTAVAASGNLYGPSSSTVYKRFVSRDFINPRVSGWACYESVQTSTPATIQAGDIAGVQGHVVMIDLVGADPFGLRQISSADGCEGISLKNFDFSVIQSSPEKGSLGINRFVAKDYLTTGSKMGNLFMGYAKAACLTKFDGVVRNPVTTEYGLIRHLQIDACLAPKVHLAKEACAQTCAAL